MEGEGDIDENSRSTTGLDRNERDNLLDHR